jgi:hypothetical protein
LLFIFCAVIIYGLPIIGILGIRKFNLSINKSYFLLVMSLLSIFISISYYIFAIFFNY